MHVHTKLLLSGISYLMSAGCWVSYHSMEQQISQCFAWLSYNTFSRLTLTCRQEATQVNLYQATLLAEPPTYEEAANLRAPSSTQQTVEPDTLPPPSYRSSTQILNEN